MTYPAFIPRPFLPVFVDQRLRNQQDSRNQAVSSRRPRRLGQFQIICYCILEVIVHRLAP